MASKCPKCESLLNRHCPVPNTTCYWQKCSRRACSAVLDPRGSRGFVMVGSTAVPIRWQP